VVIVELTAVIGGHRDDGVSREFCPDALDEPTDFAVDEPGFTVVGIE